jgi:hypothetical protein
LYSGDLGNGSVSWVDVASVVVACIEGHSTPNISFEVYNNKNKYAPEEGLKKLYSLGTALWNCSFVVRWIPSN